MYSVILAGGSGTRLRPLSTATKPKQFMSLYGTSTLLQETTKRLLDFSDADHIAISTNYAYENQVTEDLTSMNIRNIIVEPDKRNTAPAIALIIKRLEEKKSISDTDLVLICPSDHAIHPTHRFAQYVKQGMAAAQQGQIVLFGVQPDAPETGYGYIKVAADQGFSEHAIAIEKFIEKPDFQTAQTYVSEGNYFWNAGIFLFQVGTMKRAFATHAPDISAAMQQPYETFMAGFSSLPNISIDYAVLEKTHQAMVIPMHLTRSDLGSRDSVRQAGTKDNKNNVVHGTVVAHNVHNSIVIGTTRKIILDGVDNIVVIEGPDGLYVTTRGNTQNIKNLL